MHSGSITLSNPGRGSPYLSLKELPIRFPRCTRPSRSAALATTVALLAPLAATVGATVAAAPAQASTTIGLGMSLTWSVKLPYAGKPIAGSSPTVATIDGGGPVVLVGDRAGYEYAIRLATGAQVWKASTGGVPIDSTASVVGSGPSARIYVGVGNSSRPTEGAYWALSAQGRKLWSVHPSALPSRGTTGVQSSMTVGALQGRSTVVSGAMGQMAYAMDSVNGGVLGGFPWFEADSNFATPAVMDPNHVGHDEVVLGGDSTAGVAYGYRYTNGGHIRIVNHAGNQGSTSAAGGTTCQYNTTQVVQSSPAVGRFLAGNQVGIVAGTGTHFAGASDTNKLIALDQNCRLKWKADLHYPTVSSPALANVLGNGSNVVLEGTRRSPSAGTVYALNGTNGAKIWSRDVPGGIYGGVTTADLRGVGHQDVVVPSSGGVFVLDGKTGAIIGTVERGVGVQSSALITTDPNGRTGITIGGYNSQNQGQIDHYELGNYPSRVNVPGAWPMFHHDVRLTGNAGCPI